MLTALAAAPILTPVVLLLALRQSALRAGAAGFLVALGLVALVPAYGLPPGELEIALAAGGLVTWMVAYVLLGGLALYEVLRRAGALETIAAGVARLIPDPVRRSLVLVFGLSVFFESATGFGIGIVVAAPVFMALGHRPRDAALLALVGQCAVTWGALAIGTVLAGELTGVPAAWLGVLAIPFSLPLMVLCGLAAAYWTGGRVAVPRAIPDILLYVIVLSAVLAGASHSLSVETAGMIGGLAVTVLGCLLSRVRVDARVEHELKSSTGLTNKELLWAFVPFALLLAALLATRLFAPLSEALASVAVLSARGTGISVPMFYSPGFWLLATAALSIPILGLSWRSVPGVARAVLGRWVPAAMAVAGFLFFSQLMQASGMTAHLASAVAETAGQAYVLALPLVGGLGGFLTASNAGSNAMFAIFHAALGARLDLPADLVAAAQNAAGANTTLASPGRVVLAAAVTGLVGQEGALMRPVLLIAIVGLLGTAAVFAIWTQA